MGFVVVGRISVVSSAVDVDPMRCMALRLFLVLARRVETWVKRRRAYAFGVGQTVAEIREQSMVATIAWF